MSMKTKNQNELITRLASWLKQPGNSHVLLASKLGYKSSTTVSHWIDRNRVPKWQRETVKTIIEGRDV